MTLIEIHSYVIDISITFIAIMQTTINFRTELIINGKKCADYILFITVLAHCVSSAQFIAIKIFYKEVLPSNFFPELLFTETCNTK